MEIFVELKATDKGYVASIEQLPEFKLWGQTKKDLILALPQGLKNYADHWTDITERKSANYLAEIPYIQRIKSRGYYQSTLYRMVDCVEKKKRNRLDLELIHTMQRKEFEKFRALC